MDIARLDFAMLLQALHINLSSQIRLIFQLLAGIGAAAVCVYGRIRNWSENRLLIAVFSLGTCWMLLFGPSTVVATYAMIAPPLALALVQTFGLKITGWIPRTYCGWYAR